MQQKKHIPIIVRVTPALLKKIEKAATAGHRSRNAEAVLRLSESFRAQKAGEQA